MTVLPALEVIIDQDVDGQWAIVAPTDAPGCSDEYIRTDRLFEVRP